MKKTLRVGTALMLGALPALLYAFSSGPDRRLTGAPGDQTCAACHFGTAVNGGGGSVRLESSAGATYVPGQQQQLTITISDASARVYGFEMSARLDSNPLTQAGDFVAGNQQQILCDDSSIKPAGGCPSNFSLQFLEHNRPFTSNVITAQWTPPSTNVGTVTLYVAVNAANGDGNLTGDHIYTAKLQLTPAVTTIVPKIRVQDGVISASAFNPKAGAAPGTWMEIYGTDLAAAARVWDGSDFNGSAAPTTLDGVSVTVGGKNAYIDYVSPTQVNIQVPDGIPIGSGVPLILSNSLGQTTPYTLQTSDIAPALLAPPSFDLNGKQYVAGTFPVDDSGDVVFVGRAGTVAGLTTRPAKTGDVVTLYGVGFGPVSPSVSSGVIVPGINSLVNPATFLVDQAEATVLYGGLAPGFVGLYQFNIQIPAVGGGDLPLTVRVGGRTLAQDLSIVTTQ